MKRFLFISLFLHGALLLLLFSWEVPLAYRFFPRNILEVALVEKIEGEKNERPGLFMLNPPGEEKTHKKDDGGVRRLARVKENLKVGESKPEKIGPVQKEIGGEKDKKEGEIPAEPPALMAIREDSPVLMARLTPPAGGVAERRDSPLKAFPASGGGREGGAIFLPSAGPEKGQEGIAAGGSGVRLGEEGTSRFRSARKSSEDGDSVIAEILRRIEKAKRYPRMARKMGVEGRATVRFKLKPNGKVESAEVLESSGSEILDEASLETLHRAAPLPYKEGWLKVMIVFKIL